MWRNECSQQQVVMRRGMMKIQRGLDVIGSGGKKPVGSGST